jgi:hypothetical protein
MMPVRIGDGAEGSCPLLAVEAGDAGESCPGVLGRDADIDRSAVQGDSQKIRGGLGRP